MNIWSQRQCRKGHNQSRRFWRGTKLQPWFLACSRPTRVQKPSHWPASPKFSSASAPPANHPTVQLPASALTRIHGRLSLSFLCCIASHRTVAPENIPKISKVSFLHLAAPLPFDSLNICVLSGLPRGRRKSDLPYSPTLSQRSSVPPQIAYPSTLKIQK